jgi:two-component system, NarL family, sensor histidine kinase UhpB
VREHMADIRQIVGSALREMQRLARGLRPAVLDELGLAPALEAYAADYARSHGIEVDVQAPGLVAPRLPGAVETALYRIVQEALTNVARHAAATTVKVVIRRGPSEVEVSVADDGRGMVPDLAEGTSATTGHFGLAAMRERATLLGGTFTFTSNPGAGMTITVRLPLD